jgi:hypothetical protein
MREPSRRSYSEYFFNQLFAAVQRQIMFAMLDTAVNTSPNADAPEKAAIMGLRSAPSPPMASAPAIRFQEQ